MKQYHGKPCKQCATTIKITSCRRKCLECNRKRVSDFYKTPKGRVIKKIQKTAYRASVEQAKVSWADQDRIATIYEYVHSLGYHVDHIVPLNSKKANRFDTWTFK